MAETDVVVRNMPPGMDELELTEMFEMFAGFFSSKIVREKDGDSYGLLTFNSKIEAGWAVEFMDGFVVRGHDLKVSQVQCTNSVIFVCNLARRCTLELLNDMFREFGNIIYSNLMYGNKNRCLGYGFVHYDSRDAAVTAIRLMNGYFAEGCVKPLVVNWANERKPCPKKPENPQDQSQE